jgi:hypothetical protein
MLGIDTDVVIRLIISDDAEQTRRARKLVERALSHDELVLVSMLVSSRNGSCVIAPAVFRIASLQITIGRWDTALWLSSMAKRLGCLVLYRYNGQSDAVSPRLNCRRSATQTFDQTKSRQ